MNQLTVPAPAKINLFLEITGTAPDGYHGLATVMHSVDLCDEVTLSLAPGGAVSVRCSEAGLPQDHGNIAAKAAFAFLKAIRAEPLGLHIRIEKRIPSEAGLGGGSADAAAVLLGLNKLLDAGLSARQLRAIGAGIGADVPFCLLGGCALAKGIGERLTPLPPLRAAFAVLAKPKTGVSTAEAFRLYDESGAEKPAGDLSALLAAIRAGDIAQAGAFLHNVFEALLPVEGPLRIKERMLREGAAGAALTGSGSAVAGLFSDQNAADACARSLRGEFWAETVRLTARESGVRL